MIATKNQKIYIEDVQNDFIKKREFDWSGGAILSALFDSENEFYLMGIDHFSVWTVDRMVQNNLKSPGDILCGVALSTCIILGFKDGYIHKYIKGKSE